MDVSCFCQSEGFGSGVCPAGEKVTFLTRELLLTANPAGIVRG